MVPLRCSEERKALIKEQLRLAHLQGPTRPRVAWCGTIFPSEICYLFDMVPVALPMLAAIDHRNADEYLLKAARTEGLDRANCTILSAVMGRLDKSPVPDFIFHTSGSCDYYRQHMIRVIEHAQVHFGIDREKQVGSVDLPTFAYDSALSIDYVADQLRQIVSMIEDTLGVKHDSHKLRNIVENVNQARRYHLMAEELRAANPALAFGRELLKRAMLYSTNWGSESFVKLSKSCFEELTDRAHSRSSESGPLFDLGEKHRILWAYLWDYTDPFLQNFLEKELNCAIVAEELNYIHWPEIDPNHPFEGIARRIVQPINHLRSRMTYLTEMARRYRVDGIIFYIHFFAHCPLASENIQNMMRKCGYPVLFLEGDRLDKTRRPSSTITKVQAFVEQLNKMRYGNIFGIRERETFGDIVTLETPGRFNSAAEMPQEV
ncbi:MAG: 2-hydroxyacyl-CoA dehydratase family protein [Planctomycetes bacterium]|nr:2-hydroxyacyl-CoA dehydratase family protein [Planctomycetota bacterium]